MEQQHKEQEKRIRAFSSVYNTEEYKTHPETKKIDVPKSTLNLDLQKLINSTD